MLIQIQNQDEGSHKDKWEKWQSSSMSFVLIDWICLVFSLTTLHSILFVLILISAHGENVLYFFLFADREAEVISFMVSLSCAREANE